MGTINCATLKDKEEEVVEMMKRRKLDVLGLAETRVRGEGRKIVHGDYTLVWKGKDDARHGVGILVSPDLAKGIERIHYISERIIGCVLRMREEKIGVIQIYAPQSGRTTEEKEHFYEMLQAAIDLFNERLKIFVIGD